MSFRSEEEIVISRRIEILNETFYGKVYAKFSICEKTLLILKIYMNVECSVLGVSRCRF